MDLEMIRYRLQSIDHEPFENAPLERLFSELDIKERGYLNKERISDYLIQKNINFEGDRELGYVLSRFDTIQSGKINFNEFEKELTPKTSFS